MVVGQEQLLSPVVPLLPEHVRYELFPLDQQLLLRRLRPLREPLESLEGVPEVTPRDRRHLLHVRLEEHPSVR